MPKKSLLFSLLIAAVIFLVISCTFATLATETPTPTPTVTAIQPVLAGKLWLQRWTTGDGGAYISSGFFEWQPGWSAPRESTGLGFDPSKITGKFLAGSPDSRLILFTPRAMLDNVVLSIESPRGADYRAIGNTIFRYERSYWVDAWLDGSDITRGVYQPHHLCGSNETCDRAGYAATVSQDGHLILSHSNANPELQLILEDNDWDLFAWRP